MDRLARLAHAGHVAGMAENATEMPDLMAVVELHGVTVGKRRAARLTRGDRQHGPDLVLGQAVLDRAVNDAPAEPLVVLLDSAQRAALAPDLPAVRVALGPIEIGERLFLAASTATLPCVRYQA